MDEKQIEYILALAEEGSFSRAAKKIFVSQPSLSQFVSRIESSLGVILFERGTRPLVLTDEGKLYVETAKKIKAMSLEMVRAFEDIHDLKRGRLNIGLTPSKANHPLPSLLSVFKKQYPGIEISITEASSSKLEELLLKSACDIAIINLPAQSENITFEPIFSERILVATPAGLLEDLPQHISNESLQAVHSVSDEDISLEYYPSIETKLLTGHPLILLRPEQRLRKLTDNLFARVGIKAEMLLETASMETALRLTAAGLGCTFIPESCVHSYVLEKQPDYYILADGGLSWTIALAYKSGAYLTRAAQAFARVVRG